MGRALFHGACEYYARWEKVSVLWDHSRHQSAGHLNVEHPLWEMFHFRLMPRKFTKLADALVNLVTYGMFYGC